VGGGISANVIWVKKYLKGSKKGGNARQKGIKGKEKGKKEKEREKEKIRSKKVKQVQNREELRQIRHNRS
jgi:hypothetical protein